MRQPNRTPASTQLGERTQCALCQAPLLFVSVSGPGALSVAARRSLCRGRRSLRRPALCVGASLALCVEICQALWRSPAAPCVGARRSLCPALSVSGRDLTQRFDIESSRARWESAGSPTQPRHRERSGVGGLDGSQAGERAWMGGWGRPDVALWSGWVAQIRARGPTQRVPVSSALPGSLLFQCWGNVSPYVAGIAGLRTAGVNPALCPAILCHWRAIQNHRPQLGSVYHPFASSSDPRATHPAPRTPSSRSIQSASDPRATHPAPLTPSACHRCGPPSCPRAPSSNLRATHPAWRIPFFQERTPTLLFGG